MTAKKRIAHSAVPLPMLIQRVDRYLGCVLTPIDYKNCIEPHFADLQRQYSNAWRAGRPGLARWFVLRTCIRVSWPVVRLALLIVWFRN